MKLIEKVMECIVLVGFFDCSNGQSCELHPFCCGNSLVLNLDDWGVSVRLRLRLTNAANELACYSIGIDDSDGCRVGFTAREYAARANGPRLDGAVVEIVSVFTTERENRSMRRLYHHNCSYACTIVLN
jgi:hypothetical protein